MVLNDKEFQEQVKVRGSEAPLALKFIPNIAQLLDRDVPAGLMKEFEKADIKWERLKAVSELGRAGSRIPKERGVYMFVWVPGIRFAFAAPVVPDHNLAWVLYVGKAGVEGGEKDTLHQRFSSDYARFVGQHPDALWARDTGAVDRDAQLSRYLTLRPLEYWYLTITDVARIKDIESRLVSSLRPPLNKRGLLARHGATEPAF